MSTKLNEVNYGGTTVPESLQLNKSQLSKLTKEQLNGSAPVHIRGVQGYVGGDGVWTSVKKMNQLKKKNQWK